MRRIDEAERLDQPGLPDPVIARAYATIDSIHHWLGDTRAVVDAIRRDPLPVRRVLDVGCGTGLALPRLRRALDVEVVGADIRPHPRISATLPIVRADARFDPLPPADVAFSMYLGHHLAPADLVRLIRNVGRYCRRFILLDLVRHPLPLAVFRFAIARFLGAVNAEDGARSIRRSYTPAEWRSAASAALRGTRGSFRISVAPLYVRQIIDVSYCPSSLPSSRRPRIAASAI